MAPPPVRTSSAATPAIAALAIVALGALALLAVVILTPREESAPAAPSPATSSAGSVEAAPPDAEPAVPEASAAEAATEEGPAEEPPAPDPAAPAPWTLPTGALADLVEDVLDILADSGVAPAVPRLDDPLLVEQRTIVVSGDINAVAVRGVVSKLLRLEALDPGKPIDLYLRTEGGWVDDAHAIVHTMERIRSPVNTWAIGGCYSAGTTILAGGTGRRRAMEGARLMLHVNDNAGEEPFSQEKLLREQQEAYWRGHASLPESFYPMGAERLYYLSAAEALRYGIVDEVVRRER